jgi:hypothetical protein
MTRLVSLLVAFVFLNAAWAAEDLPSWNDATARRGIIEFVKAVSDKKSKDYVPAAAALCAGCASAPERQARNDEDLLAERRADVAEQKEGSNGAR